MIGSSSSVPLLWSLSLKDWACVGLEEEPRALFSTLTFLALSPSRGLATLPMSVRLSLGPEDWPWSSVKLLKTGGGMIIPSGRSPTGWKPIMSAPYSITWRNSTRKKKIMAI